MVKFNYISNQLKCWNFNNFRWKTISLPAQDLPQTISLQRRSVETHQALPSRPQSTTDTCPPARGRDSQHGLNSGSYHIHVQQQRQWQQLRTQDCEPESAPNHVGYFRRKCPDSKLLVIVKQHVTDPRGKRSIIHRRRPEVALCSVTSATSGTTSWTLSFRFLKLWTCRSWHGLYGSFLGWKLFRSAHQGWGWRHSGTVTSFTPSTTASSSECSFVVQASRGPDTHQQTRQQKVNINGVICGAFVNRSGSAKIASLEWQLQDWDDQDWAVQGIEQHQDWTWNCQVIGIHLKVDW